MSEQMKQIPYKIHHCEPSGRYIIYNGAREEWGGGSIKINNQLFCVYQKELAEFLVECVNTHEALKAQNEALKKMIITQQKNPDFDFEEALKNAESLT